MGMFVFMSDKTKKPELLAPAGTIQAGLTAIDAGADAIYTGLPRFNAREGGKNCTFEEVAKLAAYAHRHGRKIYVTLNTLIKESELSDIAEILEKLLSIRPDAVIVQDLGMLHLMKKHFPELIAHASTQMGIHNSAGVRLAERMGIKRVILQRQVTFEEIDLIRQKSNIELEVFIHGALCTGRSGSCLFSSWMGGHSGNRGRCKQPCRRRYFSEDGNGFFFSPKDLYSLEDIPRLVKMGVCSLKIEGRLKKPDYVRNVVEAYRFMLDTPPADHKKALPEAKRILSGALGRKWTTPFRGISDFKDTIQHRSLGTSGRLIGTVNRKDGNGFSAKLTSSLYLHDTIRIQPKSGNEGPAITVTKMTINRMEARKARAGEPCWIACDKPVTPGSYIFKTGSQTADLQTRIDKLPMPGITIDLDVEVVESEIRVKIPATSQIWQLDIETQPARKHALDSAALQKEFSRTGGEIFVVGNISAKTIPSIFMPASQLKDLRRKFWDWCGDNLSAESLQTAYASRLANVAMEVAGARAEDSGVGGELTVESGAALVQERKPSIPRDARNIQHRTSNIEHRTSNDIQNSSPHPRAGVAIRGTNSLNQELTVLAKFSEPSPIPNAILAHGIYDIGPSTQEAVLPEFCAEADLSKLQKQIKIAIKSGIKRFRVTSLYGLELLRSEAGDQRSEEKESNPINPSTNSPAAMRSFGAGNYQFLTITASYPLPVCNSAAYILLQQYGVMRAAAWVELGEESINNLLARIGNAGEVITYARLPLLTTRMEIPAQGEIKDARGAQFFVQRNHELTLLLPEKVFAIEPTTPCSKFIDLTHAKIGETATSEFNFPRDLV